MSTRTGFLEEGSGSAGLLLRPSQQSDFQSQVARHQCVVTSLTLSVRRYASVLACGMTCMAELISDS